MNFLKKKMAADQLSHRLVVGEVEGDSALLTSDERVPRVFRVPLALLPPGATVGQVIEMTTCRVRSVEHQREESVRSLQAELRARLGGHPASNAVPAAAGMACV